jgi:hypothetical protein
VEDWAEVHRPHRAEGMPVRRLPGSSGWAGTRCVERWLPKDHRSISGHRKALPWTRSSRRSESCSRPDRPCQPQATGNGHRQPAEQHIEVRTGLLGCAGNDPHILRAAKRSVSAARGSSQCANLTYSHCCGSWAPVVDLAAELIAVKQFSEPTR